MQWVGVYKKIACNACGWPSAYCDYKLASAIRFHEWLGYLDLPARVYVSARSPLFLQRSHVQLYEKKKWPWPPVNQDPISRTIYGNTALLQHSLVWLFVYLSSLFFPAVNYALSTANSQCKSGINDNKLVYEKSSHNDTILYLNILCKYCEYDTYSHHWHPVHWVALKQSCDGSVFYICSECTWQLILHGPEPRQHSQRLYHIHYTSSVECSEEKSIFFSSLLLILSHLQRASLEKCWAMTCFERKIKGNWQCSIECFFLLLLRIFHLKSAVPQWTPFHFHRFMWKWNAYYICYMYSCCANAHIEYHQRQFMLFFAALAIIWYKYTCIIWNRIIYIGNRSI